MLPAIKVSHPDTFFTTELGERIGLTKDSVEGNLDNNGKFDIIKQALTIFDLEDELTIKYAD